jgi:hypothetical protein
MVEPQGDQKTGDLNRDVEVGAEEVDLARIEQVYK